MKCGCHGIAFARPRISARIASIVRRLLISGVCLPTSDYNLTYHFDDYTYLVSHLFLQVLVNPHVGYHFSEIAVILNGIRTIVIL